MTFNQRLWFKGFAIFLKGIIPKVNVNEVQTRQLRCRSRATILRGLPDTLTDMNGHK